MNSATKIEVKAESAASIDDLDAFILDNLELIDLPVKHTFTPGLYSREIFMPKGSLLTSKIHRSEHPYVVLSGRAKVHIPGKGVEILEAGHSGITKANTRRALYIEEDCRWVTFHALSSEEELARKRGVDEDTLLEMIEERIIETKYLPGSDNVPLFDVYKSLMKEQNERGTPCLGQ